MLESIFTLAQQGSGNAGAAAAGAAAGIVGILFLLIYIALIVLVIAGLWKTFTKAGQPGWAAIVPILNVYFLIKIAGRPGWWIILMLIPIVSLIVSIVVLNDISKSFGRGIGTTLGLIFLSPIFFCILGFGSAEYQGPAASAG